MSVLLAGFLIGMRHALDADHLAALSVLVAEKPTIGRAAQQGAIWGVGHSTTLMLVGLAVVLLDIKLSSRFASLAEMAVGIMLVGLGLDLLRRLRQQDGAASRKRALGVGLMHGLAGSSALILFTVSTLDSKTLALSYVTLFGLGSVLGMALLSIALAWPMQAAAVRASWVPGISRGVASALSIGLGVVLINSSLMQL